MWRKIEQIAEAIAVILLFLSIIIPNSLAFWMPQLYR